MKKCLLFLLLLVGFYCNAQVKNYLYNHKEANGEVFKDYITLIFNNNSIVKGVYYGNQPEISFVADIDFEENKSTELSFNLTNYEFSRQIVSPYIKAQYFEPKKLAFALNEGYYFGYVVDNELQLQFTWVSADSATKDMVFKLVKKE
ncbi:hypothetical protein ABS768_13230 [Flavobacterium sp. ST-75]|uniref:Uncharacterized protein n=1 Tax=Flavobacterium rhizophilum TaxID=3163296 RepID=A0ABW8YGT8_9FLAO